MFPAVLGPGGKAVWAPALTWITFLWRSWRGKGKSLWSVLRDAAGTQLVRTYSALGMTDGEIPQGRCYAEGKKLALVMFTVENEICVYMCVCDFC